MLADEAAFPPKVVKRTLHSAAFSARAVCNCSSIWIKTDCSRIQGTTWNWTKWFV